MDRLAFIKTCGLALMGGSALATLLQGCAGTDYVAQTRFEGNTITLLKSEFTAITGEKTVQRKYVLVRHSALSNPICLFRIAEDHYSALLMLCTHKGCELRAQGEFLVCPCHGSEFDRQGAVQNPPAERHLQTFKTSTDHERIIIHL